MPDESLKYWGNDLIKEDLKRLKAWKSLEEDLKNSHKILCGALSETRWPPAYDFAGGLITKKEVSGKSILFYKDRVAIAEPEMSPSEGARIIYGLHPEARLYIPFLVYSAKEEGSTYKINGKKFPLTKSSLGRIIEEKIKKNFA